MKRMYCVLTCLLVASAIQGQVRMYAFGHSLMDFQPNGPVNEEQTIFKWIHSIAAHNGQHFTSTGQGAFLPAHDNLPPRSQWGYTFMDSPWNSANQPFSEADINTVLLTSGNFIQHVPSDQPNPVDGVTPATTSVSTIFNWINDQESRVKYFIYENWPIMQNSSYPLTETEFAAYHSQTQGSFHNWWVQLQDNMQSNEPDLNIALIPVGSIMSQILQSIPSIPFTELYSDLAPHGFGNIYFLAGAITYSAIYRQPIPNDYLPDAAFVHQNIRDNIPQISNLIWTALNSFNFPDGSSRVFRASALPVGLISLDAIKEIETIHIKWVTAHEINNEHFLVQRSSDAINWHEIAQIEGVGNSEQENHYVFKDINPLPGINYYRLKQMDFDGAYTYSAVVSAANSEEEINIFASSNEIQLRIQNITTATSITVYNELGQRVWKATWEPTSQINQTIPIPSAGVYFVNIRTKDFQKMNKVIIP